MSRSEPEAGPGATGWQAHWVRRLQGDGYADLPARGRWLARPAPRPGSGPVAIAGDWVKQAVALTVLRHGRKART